MKDIKVFLEKKKKKKQYGLEWYKNLSEDEKPKLIEYRKKYKVRKNALWLKETIFIYKIWLFFRVGQVQETSFFW